MSVNPISTDPLPEAELDAVRAARRQRLATGEADRGWWQRVGNRRAIVEGTIIFALWRLLVLVPITFWPAAIFPFVLIALLFLRCLPPIWAALRVIATRREKMSRRFFRQSFLLASACVLADVVIALCVGDPGGPFGGPLAGPDVARFGGGPHALGFAPFLGAELLTYGLLLGYYLIATICTRLAQGGFLRFTMPSGNGRVTL